MGPLLSPGGQCQTELLGGGGDAVIGEEIKVNLLVGRRQQNYILMQARMWECHGSRGGTWRGYFQGKTENASPQESLDVRIISRKYSLDLRMLPQGMAPLGLAPKAPCAVAKTEKSFSGKICPQLLLQWFCRWGLISFLCQWFIINAEGAWSHLSALLSVWFTALWGEMEQVSQASSLYRWVGGGGAVRFAGKCPKKSFPSFPTPPCLQPPPHSEPLWSRVQ